MGDLPQFELPLPQLLRLRLHLRMLAACSPPPFTGSALRGVMGHALRDIACITRQPSCEGCALLARCAYVSLFEPRRPGAPGGDRAATPYVIVAPRLPKRLRAGECFAFELTLDAAAAERLPYLAAAFDQAGRIGLWQERARFRLERIDWQPWLGVYDWRVTYRGNHLVERPRPAHLAIPVPPSRVLLRWVTPLRLRRGGRMVPPGELEAGDLCRALLFRCGELLGLSVPELPRSLRAMARDAELAIDQADLRWAQRQRYSSRQQDAMSISGIVGSLTLSGPAMDLWWPLLWVGQFMHIGKFTSIGLGQYTLSPAASLPARHAAAASASLRTSRALRLVQHRE